MLANSQLRSSLADLLENPEIDNDAVRPASIDLSVGRIIIPPGDDKSDPVFSSSYVVPVGGTLILETKEKIRMPATHAGLMFPKSSALAEKGILITNFGCVDPGYRGSLKFVVINLGRKPFGIRSGDRVVTLAIFKLDQVANPEYQEYISKKPAALSLEETSRLLSHDFVEVGRRARDEAKATVQNSILGWGVVLSLLVIIPSILVALSPSLFESSLAEREMRTLSALETALGERVSALERRIEQLYDTAREARGQ